MVVTVSRSEVIAFRLHAQHLAARSESHRLLDVADSCGVQNSPPGSALLGLHARVEEVTSSRLDEVVAKHKSLLQS